jgi:uncharacterized SAM-binding protein YcdF (DUF218 family)
MTDALAAASEIVVVLGGMRTGEVRARAAATLARERPGAVVIVSGRSGFDRTSGPTEAETMAAVLFREGVPSARVLLEDESRDTIGNAVLTALRYLSGAAPRPLTVVTSPFHLERALVIFRQVLGPAWPVAGHPSAALPGDDDRAADEARYLEDFRRMFEGVEAGDLGAAAARIRARWPAQYGGVERLDPAAP